MSVTNKLTAAEIIYTALVWADESMDQMISGCAEQDPYRAEVISLRKQLRAYRNRRFGKPKDPFEGAKALTLDELRRLPDQKFGEP